MTHIPVSVSSAQVAPETVIAYHGCSLSVARLLLDGQPFNVSRNEHDWLGSGVYFWEFGLDRAKKWAEEKYPKNAAVIEATVHLGHCLNLLDTAQFHGLREAYRAICDRAEVLKIVVPSNTGKKHALDCLVVNFYCEEFEKLGGKPFQTVRGCFPEGEAIYKGSRILRETHVQLAVRDTSCISNLKMV